MPLFQRSVTVPANDVVDNVIAGSQWEFLTAPSSVQFGITAGTGADNLRVDVYSGADTLAEDLEPSGVDRMPIFPDDYTLRDVALQGDRLKVRARNLSATAVKLYLGLQIDEQ